MIFVILIMLVFAGAITDLALKLKYSKLGDSQNYNHFYNKSIIVSYAVIGSSMFVATIILIYSIHHKYKREFCSTKIKLTLVLIIFSFSYVVRIFKIVRVDENNEDSMVFLIFLNLFGEDLPLLLIFIYHYLHVKEEYNRELQMLRQS